MNAQIIPVNFNGNNLFIAEQDGQPFTPMKPIVEGMGLAWQTQHRKLVSSAKRWGITKMVIPPLDPNNEAVCLPLRKIFGWLATISPSKIKDLSVRQKVIAYQNESDDVLWEHWNKTQHSGRQDLNQGFSSGQDRLIMQVINECDSLSGEDFDELLHQIQIIKRRKKARVAISKDEAMKRELLAGWENLTPDQRRQFLIDAKELVGIPNPPSTEQVIGHIRVQMGPLLDAIGELSQDKPTVRGLANLAKGLLVAPEPTKAIAAIPARSLSAPDGFMAMDGLPPKSRELVEAYNQGVSNRLAAEGRATR